MANRTPNTGINAGQSPAPGINAGHSPAPGINVEQYPAPGQAQMMKDHPHQPTDTHQNQGGILQETGTQVGNMVQGAADIGKGAAATAVSLARGTALGAANIAEGAAHAVKNTVGTNDPNTTNNPSKTSSGPNNPASRV